MSAKLTDERVTLYRCPICKVGQHDDDGTSGDCVPHCFDCEADVSAFEPVVYIPESELLALRESSRWIPVSERLPEVGACVLIYVPDGVGATIDVLHTDGKWLDWSSPNKVTHWRPLPEAPIKEVE